MGEHSWPADVDAELLSAVTGLGEEREPARQTAVELGKFWPEDQPDLRGGRDTDPTVGNPWRTA